MASAGGRSADSAGPSPSHDAFFAEQLLSPVSVDLSISVLEAPLPLACLDRLDQLVVSEFSFFHYEIGKVHVIANSGPAIAVDLKARPWISLLYVQRGEISLVVDHRSLRCAAGDCLVIPAAPLHWQSSCFNVVCLMISESELSAVCGSLSSSAGQESDGLWRVDVLFKSPTGRCDLNSVLVPLLERQLLTMGDLLEHAPNLLDRFGLDRQLAQLVALFAFPSLHRACVSVDSTAIESCAKDDFDRLTDYIRANLDRPLNLTVLQAQIHYSRRAIQYAFRQRLGCTATQWIRAQRLDLAHRLLSQSEPGESVAGVAQRCGYRSMSLFSIDFQQRFHVKPSVLLRAASFQLVQPPSEDASVAASLARAKIDGSQRHPER
jgi:AraC-like DNA-binding protein